MWAVTAFVLICSSGLWGFLLAEFVFCYIILWLVSKKIVQFGGHFVLFSVSIFYNSVLYPVDLMP